MSDKGWHVSPEDNFHWGTFGQRLAALAKRENDLKRASATAQQKRNEAHRQKQERAAYFAKKERDQGRGR